MTSTPFVIEPLSAAHDRKSFSCGTPALDRYFVEQAGQDVRRRLAAVFVAVEQVSKSVAGFYTLSALSVRAGELPPQLAKKFPQGMAIPVTLLGRLAVSKTHQGMNLGRALLFDALKRSMIHSSEIASMAVVVDAKNNVARDFYLKFGFHSLEDQPNRLFIAMGTIAQLPI